MDVITQGVIGAAAAGAFASKREVRRWSVVGALGGLAPDLDVLIRSESDPLLFLEYHRHFTHSLFFIPFGAVVVALVLSLLRPQHYRFGDVFAPVFIGYATHGLLDACTSYGTFLFWPLRSDRVAWNSISIVDPLFTGCLVLGLVLTLFLKNQSWLRAASLVAALYLAFGFVQHGRAQAIQRDLADKRGHSIVRGEVKPSFGNNFLFRSYYQAGDYYYVDAIRIPWFNGRRIYEGSSVRRIELESLLATSKLSPIHAEDIRRFSYFSAGYLIRHPTQEGVIGDLRYALLPNAIKPLWGIELRPDAAQAHTPFLHFLEMDGVVRAKFWQMLRGL
jgi:inner membrane protein